MIQNPFKGSAFFELSVAVEKLKRALLGVVAEDEAILELKAVAGDDYVKHIRQAALLAALGVTDRQVEEFAHQVMRGEA